MFSSKSIMLFGLATFAVLAAIVLSATPATAEIILYQDTFTRPDTGTQLLNGTAPEVRPTVDMYGAKADAKWNAHATLFSTDGSKAIGATSASGGKVASLPFVPQAGLLYTFSADVQAQASSNATNWVCAEFTNYDLTYTGNTDPAAHLGATGWAYFRRSTTSFGNDSWLGPNLAGPQGIGTDTGMVSVQLVLDTRPAQWTFEWIVNGTSRRGPTAFSTTVNPTINSITIGTTTSTTGWFDNVKLSVVVPEPGTLVMLSCGLIGLLAYAWRKRK